MDRTIERFHTSTIHTSTHLRFHASTLPHFNPSTRYRPHRVAKPKAEAYFSTLAFDPGTPQFRRRTAVKKLLAVLLCCAVSQAIAEVSVGANISTGLTTTRSDQTGGGGSGTPVQKITDFHIGVTPSLILTPTDRIEVVPGVGFSVTTHHSVVNLPDGSTTGENSTTDFALGGGCGLYFRLVEAQVLRFSLGPDVWFWFTDPDGNNNSVIDASLGMPVNLDLLLTDRFFVRMSSRLVTVGYNWRQTGANASSGTFTFFSIATMWTPTAGFYFTF
jgi:hypothetical protein